MKKHLNNKRGLSLVEIIVSIALLSILVLGFMQLFTVSSIVMSKSEDTLQATYTGKDTMEHIYHLSTTIDFEKSALISEGFIETSTNSYSYNKDGKSISLTLTKNGDLVRVKTTISGEGTEEAKYEAYYQWKGPGDSNEE